MHVLIACEFSGIVRDAFRARGHSAMSVDLLVSERPGPHEIGDALYWAYNQDWDLMIAHPPCTHLAVSGARYFKEKRRDGRQQAALRFVQALLDAPIPRICLENPVSIISTAIRRPDQIVHPWMFGHEESKATCLWLKNLPLLRPTQVMQVRNKNLTPSGQNKLGPSPDRWKERSRTYPGLAAAMADQWSNL